MELSCCFKSVAHPSHFPHSASANTQTLQVHFFKLFHSLGGKPGPPGGPPGAPKLGAAPSGGPPGPAGG